MKLLALALLLSPSTPVAGEIAAIPAADMNWDKTPEGVAFAPLNGDRFAESYMAMVALPAGLVSPPHQKSADMFGLIVSGTMTHVPLGQDPETGTALHAGAYYHIPAGLAHVSSCISDVECVTFLYQPGAFDFLPVSQ